MKPGELWWVDLGEGLGREQSGRRPALIVSSIDHAEIVDSLALCMPCSTRDRKWPNHVPVTGEIALERQTFAITEQMRTISRQRFTGFLGTADSRTMHQVAQWIRRWTL